MVALQLMSQDVLCGVTSVKDGRQKAPTIFSSAGVCRCQGNHDYGYVNFSNFTPVQTRGNEVSSESFFSLEQRLGSDVCIIRSSEPWGGFRVIFTCVNKMEAMYERPRDLPCIALYTLLLFLNTRVNLRANARKNYTAVEMNCSMNV